MPSLTNKSLTREELDKILDEVVGTVVMREKPNWYKIPFYNQPCELTSAQNLRLYVLDGFSLEETMRITGLVQSSKYYKVVNDLRKEGKLPK